jgi:anaerobic selenocysteine-containing dehydrogenase
MYTLGSSFWEFGEPDWLHTRFFMMFGVAEDHDSNPIKIALSGLRQRGARFVSVNPVRTGYSAIADEWIPIRPGTDGLLALAIVHVLLTDGTIDYAFLSRYTNAPWLVIDAPGTSEDGLFARDAAGNALVHDEISGSFVDALGADIRPSLFGTFTLPDSRNVKTVLSLAAERYLDDCYSPEHVAPECGVSADAIRRLAREMAQVAFRETVELPIRWTDMWGRTHDSVVGRPVAMYAMRGISAHSNGFQTCRALHLIQMLLGALDGPGNFRARTPFPRRIPLRSLPENDPAVIFAPNTALKRMPNGNPTRPEDLVIDAEGKPLRIDHAYSWQSPLSAHGMMHMVITNAANRDPYPIDTLLLFMANMAWNSSMNTSGVREMLVRKDENGEYAIPFLVVVDAFHSETVNFADLVLPDTTYFERYDAISLLDRPISEIDTVADAIRHPILSPDRDVRPWQDVLVELASRMKFAQFTNSDGSRKFQNYKDFIVNYEKFPGIGFLAGWRGKNGESHLRGEPNPNQWEAYIDHQSFFAYPWPENMRYYRYVNKDYLEFAEKHALFGTPPVPVIMQIYSEPLQKFRLAGRGDYAGPKPTSAVDRERLSTYFDPLPFWYEPLESQRISRDDYPLHAITQRPMMMYHSWDSQNVWLRQIMSDNCLYMNRGTARKLELADDDWVWVESHHGRIRCRLRTMEGVEANTVWTWNAVGKQSGAWGLSGGASEATAGFLLNHLISELLPRGSNDERRLTNSDPVTGQAAWFDLRVRVRKAAPDETGVWPLFATLRSIPGDDGVRPDVLRWDAR